MSGTFNIDQININITDVIPPENFATIDKNALVGTVYTKEQDNEWRAEVEQNVTSGIKGVAKPDDTVPATGFFRMLVDSANTYTNYKDASNAPIIVSAQDINIVNGVRKNEVTIEVNNGVSTKIIYAKVGSDGANGTANIPDYNPALSYVEKSRVFKNGSDWRVADGQTANVGDVPGVSVKWVMIGGKTENLDLILYNFLNEKKIINETIVSGIGANWTVNLLHNNNEKYSSAGQPFVTALNIPTNGANNLSAYFVPFSGTALQLSGNSSILGIKANGQIDILLGGRLDTAPKVFQYYDIDISNYVSFSLCYHLVNPNRPGDWRPLLKLQNIEDIAPQKNSVQNLIDKKVSFFENVYYQFIKKITIDIDSFTGTDDEKIEKATEMALNVDGGTVYFPNRQINITKAFLIVSNIDYIIAGQIQMANNIHDNIFRPKNLRINPAQPSGKCLDATWTENFNMTFLSTSSIRQSVVPLRTGGRYGWRGISALFVRCRNYKISGLKVIQSHMWSISNEFCENGEFYDITFDNSLYVNADGLNFRNGCRNMYAKGLRGRCTDNAVATTILDYTIPAAADAFADYSYQALGWVFGDFSGAENIIVEDCQVAAQYGQGLIIASGFIVENITYKDFVSTVATSNDWDNVAVGANQYRGIVYGTSFQEGNVRNINIINSKTTLHQYSLAIYGAKIYNLFAAGIENTNPSKLGVIRNDTTTVLNVKETVPGT